MSTVKNEENQWVCSKCGQECYYDGRCGDGPIKLCKCDVITDSQGREFYDPDDYWKYGNRGGSGRD